jgi:glycine oxidase
VTSDRPDVIIVGAGVIGCALARELARASLRVLVVERDRPGAGASSAAAGILSPQAEADAMSPLLELGLEGRALFPTLLEELRAETGIEVPYRTSGTLYIALDRDEEESLERRYVWQTAAGLPVERLSGGRVMTLEPAISTRVRLGLRFPYDHQVDNETLCRALAASAERRGARILLGREVASLLAEQDRIVGVATATETYKAPVVVLAAGAWSGLIDCAGRTLPTSPVKGQMAVLETEAMRLDRVIYREHAYLVPRLDGRILSGSTTEIAGFDTHPTARGIAGLLEQAQAIAPSLADARIVGFYAGLRPGTPDGLPILGPAGAGWPDGLWFATGHYRNGILLAPITGRLIAEAIVSARPSLSLVPFEAARFRA